MRGLWHGGLLAVLVCVLLAGCGSKVQKDINKDKDRPKPAEKEGQG